MSVEPDEPDRTGRTRALVGKLRKPDARERRHIAHDDHVE
jgi:hypothetical protein